jgi:hypothetical protein
MVGRPKVIQVVRQLHITMTDNYTGCSSDLGFPINEKFKRWVGGSIVKGRTLLMVPAARKHNQWSNKRKSDPIARESEKTDKYKSRIAPVHNNLKGEEEERGK